VSRAVLLLVNPAAANGRARAALAPVRAELQRLEVEHTVIETRSSAHAREEAGAAAAEGKTVAACGGDGFVGTVAGAVRGTDGALAVVPGGRGNDFARVLDIPSDARAAARIAARGTERMLDIALCDGTPFVCIASCGFDSDANRIANETKAVTGNLVYLYAALKALWQWKPATFRVTVDGVAHDLTGYSVAVGNSNAYGGGMYVLPQAVLDDGLLDVMTSAHVPKLRFLADLPKVFKGTHGDNDAVSFMRGERIEVSADRPFTVYGDGDPVGELPVTITVERRTLRVLVPSGA
jgi:YegS/Rv2252/BmrU family lipid kinase